MGICKFIKRSISVITVISILVCDLTIVEAKSNIQKMYIGTSGISNPSTNSEYNGDYIYYGNYDNSPIKWRVLDCKTQEFNKLGDIKTNTMLLHSDESITTMAFDEDSIVNTINEGNGIEKTQNKPNEWQLSDIQTFLNGDDFLNSYENFSLSEKEVIMTSYKEASKKDYSIDGWPYYDTEVNDEVFLLSASEANTYYKSYEGRATNSLMWWLRSGHAKMSDVSGYIFEGEFFYGRVNLDPIGVSPTVNIDLDSIIFSSAAANGKSSSIVLDYTDLPGISTNETVDTWKFTLKDNSLSKPKVIVTKDADGTYRLTYSNVSIGENQKLSAVITNEAGDELYSYGVLADATTNGSGSVNITVPEKVKNGTYLVKVFSETLNGDNETDYVGEFNTLDIVGAPDTIHEGVEFTSKPLDTTINVNYSYVDGEEVTKIDSINITNIGSNYKTSTFSVSDYYISDNNIANSGVSIEGIEVVDIGSNSAGNTTLSIKIANSVKSDYVYLWYKDSCVGKIKIYKNIGYAKLNYIIQPNGRFNVVNGVSKTTEGLGLPETVEISTEDPEVIMAPVIWNLDDITDDIYDSKVLDEQKFTVKGIVKCPDTIDSNGKSLEVTIDVIVLDAETVDIPTANVLGGIYTSDQKVQLNTTTENATIYYTTDGTTPSESNGKIYTHPIKVKRTTTIRAIAVKSGMKNSAELSYVYKINKANKVSIDLGAGDGSYFQGEKVIISADKPVKGKKFKEWRVLSNGVVLENSTKSVTSFIMPVNDVEIIAIYEDEEIEKDYVIIEGKDEIYETKSDSIVTIIIDGDIADLNGIYVDGEFIDSDNYTLNSDKTIVIFNTSYLDSLTVGEHIIKIEYKDGFAETTLKIFEGNSIESEVDNVIKDKVPYTGEKTENEFLYLLSGISGIGTVYFGKKRRI